ncbi:MAG TPA: succinate dehydrogenase cytochrome b subunit [Fimbriiglobus sp.]|jgi:succinate dehydrogenase / fumarate reductase cytochrome b subunit
MNTAAINPKGPRPPAPGNSAKVWAETYLGSSVGSKILVAFTGVGLVTFVVFHLIGNLKLFQGREAINHYADFLKHDLGVLIWIARAGLLTIFVLHLSIAIRLKQKAVAARPIGYVNAVSAQSSVAATTMIWTGVVVGAFVLFHLAHFTFAWCHDAVGPDGRLVNYLDLKDAKGRHDVYAMMIAGFSTWWISVLYLLAQGFLFVHLSHGIPSSVQTLGLMNRRFTRAVKALGVGLAAAIFLGNAAIVIAVWRGWVA